MILDAVIVVCVTVLLKIRPEVSVTIWMAVVGPLVGARAHALSKKDPPAPPAPPAGRDSDAPRTPPANGASRKKAGLRLLFEGSGALACVLALGTLALSLLSSHSKA